MKKPKLGFRRPQNPGWTLWLLALIVSSLSLLCYKLLSLVPFAPQENAVNLGSATLHAIKENISFAPIKGMQLFILKYTENDTYIRLASVAVAVTAALMLFVMLRKWHTARVSALTSLMFITSTLFLQYGRSANLDVMYLALLPALLLLSMWLISDRNNKKLPLAAAMLAITLYIPGTWIFVIAGGVFLHRALFKTFRKVSWKIRASGGIAFLATIAPLIYSFAAKPSQIVGWLGFNTGSEFTFRSVGSHFAAIPNQLFLNGPSDNSMWLVGTPIFDIFTVAMIVLGFYAYRAGKYPAREKLIFGSIVIGVLLIGIGNIAGIALLIPILYIVVANGLSYMLQSWFTVFPKNPVARPLGIALLSILVFGSCFYQLQRYYVAWPQSVKDNKALTDKQTSVTLVKQEEPNHE